MFRVQALGQMVMWQWRIMTRKMTRKKTTTWRRFHNFVDGIKVISISVMFNALISMQQYENLLSVNGYSTLCFMF